MWSYKQNSGRYIIERVEWELLYNNAVAGIVNNKQLAIDLVKLLNETNEKERKISLELATKILDGEI